MVTSETRPPRDGAAFAASTSREASARAVLTTSSSHCTSRSTDLLGPVPRRHHPGRKPGCRMPSWSAWRSPRSVGPPWRAPLAAVRLRPTWPSVLVSARPARLQQAAARRSLAAGGGLPTWPTAPPRWWTGCGCWTPLRSLRRQPPDGHAPRRAAGLTTPASQPLALVLGLQPHVLTTLTAARSPGVWRAPSRRARSPPPCWTEPASAGPGPHRRQGPCLCRGRPACGPPGGDAGPPRPPRRAGPVRPSRPLRQWIESVIDTSRASLGWNSTAAVPAGVNTRVAQRLVALAAAIRFNWQLGAEHKRSLSPTTIESTITESESII